MCSKKFKFTHKELLNSLSYDPKTGTFTNKYNRQRAKKDKINRSVGSQGYILIWLKGQRCLAHRLAWFYMTGKQPKYYEDIHHKNEIKIDNRWRNLEKLNKTQHRRTFKRGSGVEGVTFRKDRCCWIARIPVDGQMEYIGQSKDYNTAVLMRYRAEMVLNYYKSRELSSAYQYLKTGDING
jgi:hypothetical protein